MNKIISNTRIGTFLARRNLFNYLKRAEENKGSLLGRHFLEKARTERNAATFLSAEEIAEIDERISEIEKLHTPPVQN